MYYFIERRKKTRPTHSVGITDRKEKTNAFPVTFSGIIPIPLMPEEAVVGADRWVEEGEADRLGEEVAEGWQHHHT